MKILMTGASGFVGQNLKAYIFEKSIGMVEEVNFRDNIQSTLGRADALVHLAGKAHDLKKSSDDAEYFQVNFAKTVLLFESFLNSDIKDFIYFSSVKAAADTVSGILLEEVVPNPGTPYGQSKLKAEEYLLGKNLPDGKRVFILRPCMIHGPGNKGNLNLLYKFVQKGIPYPLGAFNNQRSFLSIGNLLFVIESLLTRPSIKGGVYNLSDDQPLATTDVIKIIANSSKVKPRIWKVPTDLISRLAWLGDKFHLPLNSERLKKLTENYVVSNQKLKSALNIGEMPVSAALGLTNTINSFNNS